MDYIVHGVAKSQTWLSDFHFHFPFHTQIWPLVNAILACISPFLLTVLAVKNFRHTCFYHPCLLRFIHHTQDVYHTFQTLGSLLSWGVTLTFQKRIVDRGRLTAWSCNMKSQVWKVRKLTLKFSFCLLPDSVWSKSFWLKGKLGHLLFAFHCAFCARPNLH